MSVLGTDFAGEDQATTVAVLKSLRAGLGVEDMQVLGIASADYARRVISRLRSSDLLEHVVAPKSRAARTRRGAKLP